MSKIETLSQNRISLEKEVLASVREVQDFPSPGILFKDINSLFHKPELCKRVISHLAEVYRDDMPDAIAGVESRGFYFGFALALQLGIPFIPIRKKGKLPGNVIEETYDLEYGTATIEVQREELLKNAKVIIHDDVLATGGTARAAYNLISNAGGTVLGFNFIIELSFLNGMEKLESASPNIYNLASV